MTLLRRLRGIAVSAATWAIIFAAVALARLPFYAGPGSLYPTGLRGQLRVVPRVALPGALAGLASGALFGTIVLLTERGRVFDALSGRRFAVGGFGAGMLFIGGANVAFALAGRMPLDLSAFVWTACYGAVGAGIGGATFWLARRAAYQRAILKSVHGHHFITPHEISLKARRRRSSPRLTDKRSMQWSAS